MCLQAYKNYKTTSHAAIACLFFSFFYRIQLGCAQSPLTPHVRVGWLAFNTRKRAVSLDSRVRVPWNLWKKSIKSCNTGVWILMGNIPLDSSINGPQAYLHCSPFQRNYSPKNRLKGTLWRYFSLKLKHTLHVYMHNNAHFFYDCKLVPLSRKRMQF